LLATACSEAPEGNDYWTSRLLARKLVELGLVESISQETMRRRLKTNELKPWEKQMWCIPEASAEDVAWVEDVLDLYEQPYNLLRPQVYYDERRRALISVTRASLPAQSGKRKRVDFEYRRHGVAYLRIA
jgi:hypothetical protein